MASKGTSKFNVSKNASKRTYDGIVFDSALDTDICILLLSESDARHLSADSMYTRPLIQVKTDSYLAAFAAAPDGRR